MSVRATSADEIGTDERAAKAEFSIDVVRDFASVETLWRRLEERATATPYQRFDWVRSYSEAGVEPGCETRIVVIRDAAGRPVMLLPLDVSRRAGLVTASFVGGKHANFGMPVTCRGLAGSLTDERQRSLLLAAGRKAGIDAFVLEHVPREWDGAPVALAASGRPSPSDAYGVTLDVDGPSSLRRAMSADGRKKLRNRATNLAKLGTVSYTIARTEAEIDHILAAFLHQKSVRFREQGIADPFAGAAGAFIRAGCLAGLETGRPAIELSAILVDGIVAAVFGAATSERRMSGMFVSFEPEFGRFSPGDQIVARVIQDAGASGRSVFDLGVGEADYKRRFCREPQSLVDVTIPVTLKGRCFLAAFAVAKSMKRAVKRSERAMTAVRTVRRLRSRILS